MEVGRVAHGLSLMVMTIRLLTIVLILLVVTTAAAEVQPSAPPVDVATMVRSLWLLQDGLNRAGQEGLNGDVVRLQNGDLACLQNMANVMISQEMLAAEGHEILSEQARLFLKGSELREQGYFDDAEYHYQKAAELAPSSQWGCLATYELGNVKYEDRREYDAARQYYARCLTEYPPKYLIPLQLQQVRGRWEALKRYKDIDNYRPIEMFLAANELEPAARVAPFLELITAYPETGLAQKAVLVLAELATSEETFPEVPWQGIYGQFSEYLIGSPNGPLSAHCRLALAEIMALRLRNYGDARVEYEKVLQMTQDPELTGRAGKQINRLTTLQDR